MELATIIGILLAVGGVFGGGAMEGVTPDKLVQLTAFLIVIVGSLGAALVATPLPDAIAGIGGLQRLFMPPSHDFKAMLDKILELANLARREGLLALESYTNNADSDPFLVKCLTLAIDGSSAEAIRETVEVDIFIAQEDAKAAAKFWENWGAFCPTVGVLGAVLGLIHVMGVLDQPDLIGPGIATAFVATIYGVGFANIVALPFAFKLKRQIQHENLFKEMILEGVVGIQSGAAPGALRSKLGVYVGGH